MLADNTPEQVQLQSDEPSLVPDHPDERVALGRVVSVGGSQVIVQFASDVTSATPSNRDVTVGTFLGIRNGRSVVVGSLCDISLDKINDGDRLPPAIGRVDLLGEITLNEKGALYFQRGVMAYPKIGSPIVPIGHDELCVIFEVAAGHTINVGHLQQDDTIGAYINVDDMVRKHFAIFGSTGAGKSSSVALILREIMECAAGSARAAYRPA